MNKLLNKLPCLIKSCLATATLAMPLASVGVVGVATILPSVAQAQPGHRLCYIKGNFIGTDQKYKYWKRKSSGYPTSDCDSYTYNGVKGKDVPKIRGVDMQICENFTQWKFKDTDWDFGPDGDVCDSMERDRRYTIYDLRGFHRN